MNKIVFLVCITVLNNHYLIAMDSQNQQGQDDALSATEQDCYNWFVEKQKKVPSTYQKLSQEDRDVFNKGLKYSDFPEAVTRSRCNYAQVFLTELEHADITPQYDKNTLQNVLIKMTKMMHNKTIEKPTDILTAGMYVFSQLLTEQEQAAYRESNYRSNPTATYAVVRKWSNLVCDELVKLKLLEDTQTAKDQKAQELYEDRVARFKKTYCK